MTADGSGVEWFSIDEAWDSSPITPAIAADVFADLGATGLAFWRPFEGTAVAIVVLQGRVVGTKSTARDFAASVASRTGAEVQWGPFAAGLDSGFIEGAPGLDPGDSAPETRSIYVFPTSLEDLNVDRWLPRNSAFAVTPSRAAHVVLEGRSVLITDEYGSWKWAKSVRPVVEVTAYASGSVLRIWAPSGYVEARQDPWLASMPDIALDWWQVVQFGDPVTGQDELAAVRAEIDELRHNPDAPVEGVLAELGRTDRDAEALRALAEEPWSDATVHRLISVLGLPAAAADLLRNGAPIDAEAIPLKRASFQMLRPRRAGRGLVAR